MGSGLLEVVVHIDRDLGLHLTKELPADATVALLRALLAADDPTGQTRPGDVALAALPTDGGPPALLEDWRGVAGLGGELLLLSSAEPPLDPAAAAAVAEGAEAAAVEGAEAARGGRNRSRGRPVRASSEKSEERAARFAVDGSPGTRWTSLYEDGQWLAVDLGAVCPLLRVEVQWEAACAAAYLVEGSADGEAWTSLALETGRPGWVVTHLPVGCEARWVRVHGLSRATQFGFSIYNFDVYTPEDFDVYTPEDGAPPEDPDAAAERAAAAALAAGLEPEVRRDENGKVVLDLQAALMLQEELKQGFRREVFQDQLNDLERAHERGSRAFLLARTKLYLTVQAPVLPRYGFPGDSKGVYQMMRAFGAPLLQESEAFRRKGLELSDLLHMDRSDERQQAVLQGTPPPAGAQERAGAAPSAAEAAARAESLREALAQPAQVVEYRVLQRALVKRLGRDPGATEAAVRLTRQVGSIVFATGRTWKGRRGGEWVELDPITEKPGWLLVEGPGFGVPGPLLQRVEPGEEPPMLLHAERPVEVKDLSNVEYRYFLLPKTATVRDAKEWISLIFGLEPQLLIIARPDHVDTGDVCQEKFITSCAGLLSDKESLASAGFADGSEVHYVFTGNLQKAYEGKEPTWAGKLGAKAASEPKPKAKALPGTNGPSAPPRREGLEEHFKALGLDPSAPPEGIKRHYRKLALECHPDKHPEDVEGATQRFQAMKAAYEAIRERLQF